MSGGGNDYYLNYTALGTNIEDGIATDLVQLTPGDYEVTRFEIVEKINSEQPWSEANSKILLATPMDGSAFQEYVSETLPAQINIQEYEKNRKVFDVLCFNQQAAPAFGFEWFDYNIVEGDEICVFVNCINENDRDYYHQVFAADMYAWKTTLDGETVVRAGEAPYWEIGSNYTLVPDAENVDQVVGSVDPMCFPLYALLDDMENGVILQLKPVFGRTSDGDFIYGDDVWVHISRDIILDYLMPIEDYQGLEETDPATGITVKVEKVEGSGAENPRYIHITLPDCNKPAYFESHNDDNGNSAIYTLLFNGNDITMTKILDNANDTEIGRDPHIAVAPNRRQLYVVNSDVSAMVLVYDLYTMSFQTYTASNAPAKITQLVYMGDKLLAADMDNDQLLFYQLDTDGMVYTDYETVPLSGDDFDFSGGDLIATTDGNLLSFNKSNGGGIVYQIDLTSKTVTQMASSTSDLAGVFGAMVYENGNIITGQLGVGLKEWDTSLSMLGTFTPVGGFTYVYGDLASPFVLDLPNN
ncbi:hypothetical protein SD074_30320 [Prolixibacter sp. SD074]|nr:hypothetical protein SD074_30320 [Prolixibacter sp. SD074]